MYWRNKRTAADLVGRNIPQSYYLPTNSPFPWHVFLQTYTSRVGLSKELHHQVLQNILNITCMYLNAIISYSFMTARPTPSRRKTWTLPSLVNEIYLPYFPHFRHIVVYDLGPLALWYWCNIHIQLFSFRIRWLSQQFPTISVLKLNLLQEVEMWLRHVYFHCQTTWSTAHVYYVISNKKFPGLKISLADHRPELYRKLIVFLRIVVWHMRVSARLLHVWGFSAGCCDVIKNTAKNAFLLRFLNIRFQIIVIANIWRCNMHVILF